MARGIPAAGCFAALLLLLLASVPAAGAGQDPAIVPGETLEYGVKWEFVPAGRAKMQIRCDRLQDRPVYRFVLKARTNSFVSLFYKLRERIDSYTATDMGRSYLYKERNKGSEKKKIVVSFDWTDMVARHTDFGKDRKRVSITAGTLDPLASLYAFRTRDLRPGAVIEMPVSDGEKHFTAKAVVAGRERIEVNGREYETYVVKPDVNYFGGVFEESEDPALTVWLTADERKVPVRVDVKVAIGSVVAELESVNRPQETDTAAR